jgi:rhodanese-related sulfurtransferase
MTIDPSILKNNIDADLEVSAVWAAAHRDAFKLVDVREPHELVGPLGQIEGVKNMPLLQLLGHERQLDPTEPLVLVCRSGRRSGLAAKALAEHGFAAVASVEGGMLAWNIDVLGKAAMPEEEKTANATNLGEAIYRTNGVAEVSAQWVQKNIGRFRLIDVREPNELASVGRVAQSENIPLSQFMEGAEAIPRDTPMVVMCASGGRSGRVVRALESAGFGAAASMEGGMFGWKAYGLPVA